MANSEQAIVAGGCFWCTEAVFRDVIGVSEVESGYIGGTTPNPTYKQVCTDRTGHAEVVEVQFDPAVTSYEALVRFFFSIHNPGTRNRQGQDVGTQYRSVIFFHTPEQQMVAQKVIDELNQSRFAGGIVTELSAAGPFWRAEEYHQKYADKHPTQACAL